MPRAGKPVASRNTGFYTHAQARAIEYRKYVLQLESSGEYEHRLSDHDSSNGWNFLPSLRKEILDAVRLRADLGKGVGMDRTTGNMLASQAMCFNLFVPLNLNKPLASKLFSRLLEERVTVSQEIQLEYTPPNSIFGDQTGASGVDCDVLLRYGNARNEPAVMVIETKYVESEFSRCGYRKESQKNRCPADTMLDDDFTSCRYKALRHYRYWEVAEESGLFTMDAIKNQPCPFGNLWQLWVNMTLAYGIAKEEDVQDFRYAVICPKGNTKLSGDGAVFERFRSYLAQPNRFMVIYLEDIAVHLKAVSKSLHNPPWIGEFIGRYVG